METGGESNILSRMAVRLFFSFVGLAYSTSRRRRGQSVTYVFLYPVCYSSANISPAIGLWPVLIVRVISPIDIIYVFHAYAPRFRLSSHSPSLSFSFHQFIESFSSPQRSNVGAVYCLLLCGVLSFRIPRFVFSGHSLSSSTAATVSRRLSPSGSL
jgi:hypothetical protein